MRKSPPYLEGERRCTQCGTVRAHKGTHAITFQTLFGTLTLKSPRWKHCACQAQAGQTFSPLALLLTEHVSPERLFLETKWGSLLAFEPAANLLKDTLPITATVSANTVRNHLQRVAQRAEDELGDERASFLEGCSRDRETLSRPPAPITVGLDGGYVRQWEDKNTPENDSHGILTDCLVFHSWPKRGNTRETAMIRNRNGAQSATLHKHRAI